MYINPINEIYKDMEVRINQHHEEMIVNAVRECDIEVDKEELIKALKYDRNQYQKGYNDALDEVVKHICESKECYKKDCKGVIYRRCPDIMWVYELR